MTEMDLEPTAACHNLRACSYKEDTTYNLADVKVIDMASDNNVEDCMDVFKEVLPVYLQFPLVLPSPNFHVSPAHSTSLSCL